MALPKTLKYFNLFINGDDYIGKAQEVTLPKLTRKLEDYRGAGMPGSVAVDLGFDSGALDMEITLGGTDAKLLALWSQPKADGISFKFSGSFQDDGTGDAVPLEIITRGRFSEQESGTMKQGELGTHKFSIKNTYCKITENSQDILEVDMLNMIHLVNGVDLLEKHRKNLGR